MFKKISKSEDFLNLLRTQGKVTSLNTSKHIQATNDVNAHMAEIRREFTIKNWGSNKAAETIILNC
jgi:hypothetical protein